ncbi:MAG TPA: MASE1 domain-containing protein [Burkholderiales bacterium]|jgi:signal transduction histidine kinase|nr:MASE1 domain-containing protein [Burkholderiales bacterium]
MDSLPASSASASAGLTPWGTRSGPVAGWAAPALAVAVGYYLAARVGFAFTLQPYPISTLWPPNALLLAALLLAPTRAWWWVLAAALPAHLLVELQSGVPVAMVLGWYATNCSEALLGAGLVRAFVAWPLRLDSLRSAGIFLFSGAFVAPIVSSFLDAALVSLVGWGERGYWDLVGTRIFSNTLAALTVAPLILTWAAIDVSRLRAARLVRYAEAAALFMGLLATCMLVFDLPQLDTHTAPALFYAPLPFLVWAALRFGPAGTTSAIAVMVVATIFGTVNGLGPFAGSTPQETALEMQLFLSAVAVPMLLLAVVLDERARVELDAREQRLQLTHLSRVAMLGELSGGIAHELNQPLTAILSNAQAAQHLVGNKSADPEILVEILRDIIAADQRAGEVIRRLRTLFKRGETQFQPLDANELVHEVLSIVHGDLVTRSVEVVPELAAALPKVQGDRVELEQVMLNLVMNACDAMAGLPPEQRRIRVRTRAVDVEGGAVQVSFGDCGPGFTPEQYAKLFEPFYTTKPRGLGLGLSISRAIIRAHHGRLWGSSTPGAGAAFHFVLPALRAKRG